MSKLVEKQDEYTKALELLKASYQLLKKCDENKYQRDPMVLAIFYDDVNRDGYSLMMDIAAFLHIEDPSLF